MRADHLLEIAKKARRKSYSPYSGVKVGAALETEGGKVFSACNVENASYGLSCCAERAAMFKAVSEGFSRFKAIAIVTEKLSTSYPCGACRQVMIEFSPNMQVLVADLRGRYQTFKARDLTPHAFLPGELRIRAPRRGKKRLLPKAGQGARL